MRKKNIVVAGFILLLACSKNYVEVDPATGQEIATLNNNANSVCEIIRLKQINGQLEYNAVTYNRDSSGTPIGLNYSDSSTKTVLQTIRFSYAGDTVKISNKEWLLLHKTTKNVLKYYKRTVYMDTTYDDEMYEYLYDNLNRLVTKNAYYNGSTTPDYITTYQYNTDNNLTDCKLVMAIGNSTLLHTTIQYDGTKKIKPWIYLYGDSFENYLYLLGFKYGVKPGNAVSQIKTEVLDIQNGTVLDTWKTNFVGYLTSKDNYVLQVDCTGDMQQGLGVYLGTMRFDYSCK
jgi:hypothetical protein